MPPHHSVFEKITRPTLLLDESRAARNIQRMAEKASLNRVRFRPHFKTHQSAGFSPWFRAQGVTGITVSSVSMAEYFARAGWRDITIAFPLNPRELPVINRLARRVHLEILLEHSAGVETLLSGMRVPLSAWIKVDVGAHRTGIPVEDNTSILRLAGKLSSLPGLTFRGILTHAGQTYHACGAQEVQRIYTSALTRLLECKQALTAAGYPSSQISWGDTPSCSLVDDLSGVDELRPGNFVLYDASQLAIGSCREEDIAAAVACPIVALHPERSQVVIHGGAVHLSKEALSWENGLSYGLVALPSTQGWGAILPDCHVQALSQEHGIVHVTPEVMTSIRVGDLLVVIPVHSCLAVNLHSHYLSLSGKPYRIFH